MVKEFLQPYLFNHERPVLIIDDSSVYRSAAKGILQKLGFEARNVHQAQNGREAKTLCAEHNYAIIFYDYNLGAGLSGYHLMEELVSEKAIASDCTNIVVSAEGAVNVVRSFMELSPDGYLLKPISHDILKQKLPTIVKTKATLSEAYIALDQGRFEQVLEMTEEMIQEDESTLIAAQALKARAQIELNLLHDARNTLVSLQQVTHLPISYFMQFDIALKQRQYKQAQFILDHMPKNSVSAPLVLDRQTTVQIMQSRLEMALMSQKRSIKLSAMRLERYWILGLIEMALCEFSDAQDTFEYITNHCKLTRFDHVDTYNLGAQMLLDQCQFSQIEIRNKEQTQLRFYVDAMKKRGKHSDYNITESLLIARYQLLYGNRKLFVNAFNLAQSKMKDTSLDTLGLFNCIELLKIASLTQNDRQVNRMQEQIRTLIKEYDPVEAKLIQSYLAQWRNKTQLSYTQAESLRKDADTLLKAGKNERAIELLIQSLELNKVDTMTPRLLLFALTRTMPPKMSRTDCISLVYRCIRRVNATPYIQTAEFKSVCKQLEKNLLVPDFARAL